MVNVTNFINQTDLLTVTQTVNSESGGVFGFMLLISIYLVVFFPTLKYGSRAAFSTSAFVGATLAILLRLMEIISDTVLFASIVVLIGAVLMLWFSKDSY